MPRTIRAWLLLVSLSAVGCSKPDSVELGGVCRQQEECKDPADTCMTLGAESLCTMACSADKACPEDYACARMDIQVQGAGGEGKADAAGYCLARSRLGANAATIRPKGDGKSSKGPQGKRKKGKRTRKDDASEPSE